MHESEKVKVKVKSCLTLSNPMDCSPPGSSIHGIFWATVLEWGAIAFSQGDYDFFKRDNTSVGEKVDKLEPLTSTIWM